MTISFKQDVWIHQNDSRFKLCTPQGHQDMLENALQTPLCSGIAQDAALKHYLPFIANHVLGIPQGRQADVYFIFSRNSIKIHHQGVVAELQFSDRDVYIIRRAHGQEEILLQEQLPQTLLQTLLATTQTINNIAQDILNQCTGCDSAHPTLAQRDLTDRTYAHSRHNSPPQASPPAYEEATLLRRPIDPYMPVQAPAQHLEASLYETERAYQKAQGELDALRHAYAQLQEEQDAIRHGQEHMHARLAQTIKDQERALHTIQRERENLVHELQFSGRQNHALEARLQQTTDAYEEAQRQLETLYNAHARLQEEQQAIMKALEQQEQRNAHLTQAMQQQERQLADAEKEKQCFARELELSNEIIQVLGERQADLENTIRDLENAHSTESRRLFQARAKLTEARLELSQKEEELAALVEQQQTTGRSHQEACSRLRQETTALENHVTRLETAARQSQEQLQAIAAELIQTEREKQDVLTETRGLRAEQRTLQQALAEKTRENTSLKLRLESLERSQAEASRILQKHEETHTHNMTVLQSTLDGLKGVQEQDAAARRELAQTKTALNHKEYELTTLKERMDQLEAEILSARAKEQQAQQALRLEQKLSTDERQHFVEERLALTTLLDAQNKRQQLTTERLSQSESHQAQLRTERDQLRAEAQEREERLTIQDARIRELEQQLRATQQEARISLTTLQEKDIRIAALEADSIRLQKILAAESAEKEKLHQSLLELQKQAETFTQHKERAITCAIAAQTEEDHIARELERTRLQLRSVQTALKEAQSANGTLQTKLETAETTNRTSEQTIIHLTAKNTADEMAMKAERQRLEGARQELQSRVQGLEQRVRFAEQHKDIALKTVETLRETERATQQQIEAIRRAQKAQEERDAHRLALAETTQQKTQKELSHLRSTVQERDATILELKRTQSQLQKDLQDLQQSERTLQTRLEIAQRIQATSLETAEARKTQINDLERELQKTQDQQRETESALRQAQFQIKRDAAEKQSLQERIATLETETSTLRRTETVQRQQFIIEKENLEAEQRRLLYALEESKENERQVSLQLEQSHSELTKTKQTLRKKTDEVEKLEATLLQTGGNRQYLLQEHERLTADLAQLRADHQALTARNAQDQKLAQSVPHLEAQIQDIRTQLESIVLKRQDLERTIKGLRAEKDTLIVRNAEQERFQKELEATMVALQQKHHGLLQTHAELLATSSKRMEAFERVVNVLRGQTQEAQRELATARKELEALKAEKGTTSQEHRNAISAKDSKIDRLNRQLTDLETANKSLEESISRLTAQLGTKSHSEEEIQELERKLTQALEDAAHDKQARASFAEQARQIRADSELAGRRHHEELERMQLNATKKDKAQEKRILELEDASRRAEAAAEDALRRANLAESREKQASEAIRSPRERAQALMEELATARTRIHTLTTRIQQLEEASQVDQEIDAQQNSYIEGLKTALDESYARVRDLETELARLKDKPLSTTSCQTGAMPDPHPINYRTTAYYSTCEGMRLSVSKAPNPEVIPETETDPSEGSESSEDSTLEVDEVVHATRALETEDFAHFVEYMKSMEQHIHDYIPIVFQHCSPELLDMLRINRELGRLDPLSVRNLDRNRGMQFTKTDPTSRKKTNVIITGNPSQTTESKQQHEIRSRLLTGRFDAKECTQSIQACCVQDETVNVRRAARGVNIGQNIQILGQELGRTRNPVERQALIFMINLLTNCANKHPFLMKHVITLNAACTLRQTQEPQAAKLLEVTRKMFEAICAHVEKPQEERDQLAQEARQTRMHPAPRATA